MLALSLALTFWLAQAPAPPPPSETISVPAAMLLASGDGDAGLGKIETALAEYKKADSLSRHHCVACLLRIVGTERNLGDPGAARHAAQQALTAAAGHPDLLAQADEASADLLAALAGFDQPKSDKLAQAADLYNAALAAASDDAATLHFKLAIIRLRQNRDPEGLSLLHSLLQQPRLDPALARQAREILAHPQLARESIVPDFSLTTELGVTFSKDSLQGKVVLLDFWGTWCPPCRDSVPMLQALHHQFRDRPDFVMLGISSDVDAEAWRSFVAAHGMDWPEYLDSRQTVIRQFGVYAYPTYLVMNRDGSVALVDSGLDMAAAGRISGESQMALAAAIKKALGPLSKTP